jgi:hypothetical protein
VEGAGTGGSKVAFFSYIATDINKPTRLELRANLELSTQVGWQWQ